MFSSVFLGNFPRGKCFRTNNWAGVCFRGVVKSWMSRCYAIDSRLSPAAELDRMFIFPLYFPSQCFSTLSRASRYSSRHVFPISVQMTSLLVNLHCSGKRRTFYNRIVYLTWLPLFAIISHISCARLVITASVLMDWFLHSLCLLDTYSSTYTRYSCWAQT